MECFIGKLEQYIEIFAALSSVLLTVREKPRLVRQTAIGFANSLRQYNYDVSKNLSDLSKGERDTVIYM